MTEPRSNARDLTRLAESERWLVVDKPSGVPSVRDAAQGPRAVPEILAEHGVRAIAVHRLDRDVSGVLLFARDEATRAAFEEMFRERALEKIYWALARGRVAPEHGAWKFPLLEERGRSRVSALGKKSETRYRTLAKFAAATELEIELVTGRYNQIRVHAAHAGFALIGERKYARGSDDPLKAGRLALHARRLSFCDPWSGEPVTVESPLPRALEEMVARAATAKPRGGDARNARR